MPLLLPPVTFTVPVTVAVRGPILTIEPGDLRSLLFGSVFAYGGSGGTSVDAYVQTSYNGGQSWFDIRNFHFTTFSLEQVVNHSFGDSVTTAITPASGALANNTSIDGILGDKLSVLYKSAGTYAGGAPTTLALWATGCRLRA